MFALDQSPTPRLGLDLQGGTSITLTASSTEGSAVTDDAMRTAVEIIRSRVDGAGVAESEVTTQGSNTIVVAVPGVNDDELVKLVGTTAELRFRQVLQTAPGIPLPPATTPPATPNPSETTPGATTPPSTTAPPTTASPSSTPAALGMLGGRGTSVQTGFAAATVAETTPPTTAPATTPPTSEPPATEPPVDDTG